MALTERTVVIQAAHYAEAEKTLAAEDVVKAMAIGLRGVPREQLAHEGGGPRFEFMMGANAEYTKRAGHGPEAHIGAVANALLSLLDVVE